MGDVTLESEQTQKERACAWGIFMAFAVVLRGLVHVSTLLYYSTANSVWIHFREARRNFETLDRSIQSNNPTRTLVIFFLSAAVVLSHSRRK
jgi:hypothetical protein